MMEILSSIVWTCSNLSSCFHPIAGDPVTDHGLLNPTYLEALLWEGQRYQSLYKSPIGVDAAFIGPLASSATWFPDFAYRTTKQLILVVLQLFMWMREVVRSILMELRGKRGEHYEPIPQMTK